MDIIRNAAKSQKVFLPTYDTFSYGRSHMHVHRYIHVDSVVVQGSKCFCMLVYIAIYKYIDL